MNIWDIIKNPVMIGLFVGVITYSYMKWKNNKDYKKTKKKKDINLLIPFTVFIVFWFISYAYFSSSDDDATESSLGGNNSVKELKQDLAKELAMEVPNPYKQLVRESDVSSDPQSFYMVSNGIQIPQKIPPILFDIN